VLRDIASALLDLWLPPRCVRCDKKLATAPLLCAACVRCLSGGIPARPCLRCGEALALHEAERCRDCRRRRSPLDAVVAAAPFEGELMRWLHRFKYPERGLRGLDPAADALVLALAGVAAGRLRDRSVDLVCPVPPDPARLRERGFHPAGQLAWVVARTLDVRFVANALRMTRVTASQTGLDRAARRRNVKGAISTALDAPSMRRTHVLLVDDVTTTGVTLEECARVLRRHGARSVTGFVVARTPSGR
jgi:ComF family protein